MKSRTYVQIMRSEGYAEVKQSLGAPHHSIKKNSHEPMYPVKHCEFYYTYVQLIR